MRLKLWPMALIVPNLAFALINGSVLEGNGDLVRLVYKNGWVCSGAYLDPYTILTAAHCVSGLSDPTSLKTILTENDEVLDVTPVELIAHPNYEHQSWPVHDVGVIKTTENRRYQGAFKLTAHAPSLKGSAILYGCGRTDVSRSQYSRTTGENGFLKVGSVLVFVGKSSQSDTPGQSVTIAPNDSGAPVVDKSTSEVIGVASQTTAKTSGDYRLPAVSFATSVSSSNNLEFIRAHLGSPVVKPGS